MSSKYNTSTIKVFDNEVLEVMFENQLITAMDMQQFAHADYSLTQNPGMKKKIRTYVGKGNVEELAMGEGNSVDFGSEFHEVEYEVGTTQGRGHYYDEQIMDDPDAVNKMLQHMTEEMTNDMTRKIVKEMEKATQVKYGVNFGFDVISDAIAEFPDESTEKENLFLLISRADSSLWRKALGANNANSGIGGLQYVEAYVRRGYIGTVCGVSIYWNDAVPKGEAFLATREAVTIFVKKGVEAEQERDADHRDNKVWLRKVMLVALENANKLIMLTTKADPDPTHQFDAVVKNGAAYELAGQEVVVTGSDIVPGVDAAWSQAIKDEFPLPLTKGIVVQLKNIIPSTGATIVQDNPALKAYYDAESPDIAKKGNRYIKTKTYTGSDPNYELICEEGKIATVSVNGVVYTVTGSYKLV